MSKLVLPLIFLLVVLIVQPVFGNAQITNNSFEGTMPQHDVETAYGGHHQIVGSLTIPPIPNSNYGVSRYDAHSGSMGFNLSKEIYGGVVYTFPEEAAGETLTFWYRKNDNGDTDNPIYIKTWAKGNYQYHDVYIIQASEVTVGQWYQYQITLPSYTYNIVSVTQDHNNLGTWSVDDFTVSGVLTSPIAAFSGTPLTGYPPLSVGFSDSSLNEPTSWLWDFGDGYTSTLQNPGHLFNNSGSYNVALKVTNAAGSDWENKTSYVTVNPYQLPVCSAVVQGSSYQGNSPLHVWMNDTSTNDPTTFYWDFNYQDFGWFTISPNELNTTADPDVIITGTGTLPVYHYVSNPAGTAYCPMYYFNISGAVPTPTPTPAIPFPNQTGVCVGSSISLGSNAVTDFPRYSYVTDPDGNIFSDFFDSGDTVILSGSSLTRKLGQYYYAEKNESQQLLWQSSYVTVDCSPTPTQTYVYSTVPTPHVSLVPTQTPIPMITTFSPNANLNGSIVPLHLVIPTLEPTRNTTGDVNITQMKENILELSPLFAVYINTTEIILYPIYYFFVTFFTWVFSLLFFVNWGLWAVNTFQTMLYSITDLLYVTLVAFSIVISNIPVKVQNVITFCLLLDFIRQLYNLKRGDRL